MSTVVIDLVNSENDGLSDVQLSLKAAALQNKTHIDFVAIGTKKQLLPLSLPNIKTIACEESTHLKALADFSAANKEFTLLSMGKVDDEWPQATFLSSVFGSGSYFYAYWLKNLAQGKVFFAFAFSSDALDKEVKTFADLLKTSIYDFKVKSFNLAELTSLSGIVFGDEQSIKLVVNLATVVSDAMLEQFKKNGKQGGMLSGLFAQGAFAPTNKPLQPFFTPIGKIITDGKKTVVFSTYDKKIDNIVELVSKESSQ